VPCRLDPRLRRREDEVADKRVAVVVLADGGAAAHPRVVQATGREGPPATADGTGAVGSSGAGASFRRLSHRLCLGHRLHVEPAVTQTDPHALVGLDVAREQPLRELVLQEPLDGSAQRARPVLWIEAGVRQVLDRLVGHLAAQRKAVHQLINASAILEYGRIIQALHADVDTISTVMTNAQQKVVAPAEQALPLSRLKTAVWDANDERKAACKAEKDQQRAAYEREWGKPSGGWR